MDSNNASFSKTVPKLQFFLSFSFFFKGWILMGVIKQCTYSTHPTQPHPAALPQPTTHTFPKFFLTHSHHHPKKTKYSTHPK